MLIRCVGLHSYHNNVNFVMVGEIYIASQIVMAGQQKILIYLANKSKYNLTL